MYTTTMNAIFGGGVRDILVSFLSPRDASQMQDETAKNRKRAGAGQEFRCVYMMPRYTMYV